MASDDDTGDRFGIQISISWQSNRVPFHADAVQCGAGRGRLPAWVSREEGRGEEPRPRGTARGFEVLDERLNARAQAAHTLNK